MKKVVYSVQKIGKQESPKMTGLGYLADRDLVIACISQKGKPYIKVFDDVREYCHPIVGRDGEFKGEYTEHCEIDVEKVALFFGGGHFCPWCGGTAGSGDV